MNLCSLIRMHTDIDSPLLFEHQFLWMVYSEQFSNPSLPSSGTDEHCQHWFSPEFISAHFLHKLSFLQLMFCLLPWLFIDWPGKERASFPLSSRESAELLSNLCLWAATWWLFQLSSLLKYIVIFAGNLCRKLPVISKIRFPRCGEGSCTTGGISQSQSAAGICVVQGDCACNYALGLAYYLLAAETSVFLGFRSTMRNSFRAFPITCSIPLFPMLSNKFSCNFCSSLWWSTHPVGTSHSARSSMVYVLNLISSTEIKCTSFLDYPTLYTLQAWV